MQRSRSKDFFSTIPRCYDFGKAEAICKRKKRPKLLVFKLVIQTVVHHLIMMMSHTKYPAAQDARGLKKPDGNRQEVLHKVAEAKRRRDQDASQAMKDHEANRIAVLAKTARLRAARLARVSEATLSPKKAIRRKKN